MGYDVRKPRRGWLHRNWAVFLGIGLGVSAGIGAFVILRCSDVTKLSVGVAESSPVLTSQLGQPLKLGWFIVGSIDVRPESGRADLEIPVSGPKGSGTLYSKATKEAGMWHVHLLQLRRDGSAERLDLLPSSAKTLGAAHP